MTDRVDVIVIGAGIVGLATARALTRLRPGMAVRVLEKEEAVGTHQTGHNSGVIHSGLYYRPGSRKARLCVRGRRELLEFCDDHDIETAVRGKLVVATRRSELPALETLAERGVANGLSGVEKLGPEGIVGIEPLATGVGALHVPEAGVVDFGAVAAALARDPAIDVHVGQPVASIRARTSSVVVEGPEGTHEARFVVNCAGLHSDRVARMAGIDPEVEIMPFRGEYYNLDVGIGRQLRSMIYPVPDPRFPFLGVHLTRTIGGTVEVGPNAVLALGREHYRGTPIDWRAMLEMAGSSGLRRLAGRYWKEGAAEVARSRLRSLYARSARRLVPGISAKDLQSGGSGVRAQAITAKGDLVDDFVFRSGVRSLHVLNAPSPAATASFAIGDVVARECLAALDR